MKRKLVSLLMALVLAVSLLPVSALAAETPDYELRVLTFEDADYKGGVNFAGGSNWSSLIDDPQYGGRMLYGDGSGVSSLEEAYTWTDTGNTELSSRLCSGYGSYCYWSGGHAISNYVSSNFSKYGNFNNQLTVYQADADTTVSRVGGGHNGSDNFAVHYGYMDGSSFNMAEELPALTFADGAARVIDHMYVNNICYAVNCYIDGNGLTAKIGPDDWVKLVATGYNGTEKTGETSIYLCNGPDNIVLDWTKFDLSGLGAVTKVEFNVTGSSDNGYGFSQPAYFAYDDVAVRFEKAPEPAPNYTVRVLTFEDADYKGGVNFAGGSDWSSLIEDPQYGGPMLYPDGSGTTDASKAYTWTDAGNTELTHMLPYSWNNYCYWGGGHAISHYTSGEASKYGDYNHQLTVYQKGVTGIQTTGGGHNGSNNFAVHFGYKDNSGYTDSQILPSFSFADGVARVIDHMYVNNVCYAVNCYIDGNGLTAKIGPDDWVKLTATGYNGTEKTGETSIYLCNGPDNIVLDWTKFDLSGLGAVTKVEFNITGSSDNGYGFSQPAYFAYDDVAVRFENNPTPPAPAGPISVKTGDGACAVTAVEGQTGQYRAVVPYGSDVTIEVADASFLMVSDAKYGYVNEAGVNPFTLTVSELDGVTLTAKQVAKLVKFTPAANSKIAYLSIMDVTGGTSYELFLEMTVKAVPATGLTLDQSTLTLHTGETAVLTASVQPENTTETVVWTSSDDTVAAVTDGKITALKEGAATITAACGSVKASCALTVEKPVAVTGVTLDKSALSLFAGDTAVLTASVVPENAADQTVTWSSSDEAVASVKDGTVTAAAAGSADITVKTADGSFTAVCRLTVQPVTAPQQKDGVYQIGSAAELAWLARAVNGGDTALSAVLTADVDLGGALWTPIGTPSAKFSGTLDGQGHTVKGLAIDHSAASGERLYLGLFGYAEGAKTQHAVIRDLTVSGSVSARSDSAIYTGYVGGVLGRGQYVDLSGIVSRVTVTADENVGRASNVGGLAGCIVNSTVTNCGNEGRVTGYKDVGGLIGWFYGDTMTGCYNTGDVSGTGANDFGGITGYAKQSVIKDVYNTGHVTGGKNYIGGLVGLMEKATLTNGYSTGTVTALQSGGAAVGALVGEADTGENLYYLESAFAQGVGRGDGVKAEAKSAEELRAAALLTALGRGFKKDLGSINGRLPVLAWQTSECPSHYGGTANCRKGAVCDNCGVEYTAADPANHTGAPVWTQTASAHEKVYDCCGAVVTASAAHSWQKGVCTVCGYTCLHSWDDGVVTTQPTLHAEGVRTYACALCGSTRTASVPKLTQAEADQAAADAVTEQINAIGTVTKSSKAQIRAAAKAYTGLTDAQRARIPASVVKTLTDAEAAYAALTGHTGSGSAAAAAKPAQASRTGDAGIAVYAAMSLLSVTGGAWIIGSKRKTR